MSELNPDKKIAHSEGIDRPVMYVYLAGRIAGNCIDKCLAWRYQIINHYRDYKKVFTGKFIHSNNCGTGGHCGCVEEFIYESYPIAFLDALNSKESDSVDAQGLTSAIPSNLIYDKDMMSVKKADVVVAYMEDYMEEGIEGLLSDDVGFAEREELEDAYDKLVDVIKNRRPNYGTTMEISWALWLQKPLILIAGDERRKKILESHPFTKRASVIVKDVDELLEKKWLNILYKSISSAIY